MSAFPAIPGSTSVLLVVYFKILSLREQTAFLEVSCGERFYLPYTFMVLKTVSGMLGKAQ